MTVQVQEAVKEAIHNPRQEAAKIFASEFGGSDVPATNPAGNVDMPAEKVPEPAEAPSEPEGEPLAASGEPEGGEALEPTEEGEAEGGTAPDIRTLKDLAAAIEVDPSYLYDLEMHLSEGETLKLGEIKDRLQEAARIKISADKVEAGRQQLEKQQQEWVQQQQQAQQQFLQAPQEAIQAQASMIALERAWQELEKNQGEYNSGDLALKRQEIQTAYGQAQQQRQQATTQLQQQQAAQKQHAMRAEAMKTLEAIPDWRDQAKAIAGRNQITELMNGYGFDSNAVNSVYDSRILRLLHDFAVMKSGVTAAEKAVAKGPRVPKVLRTGAVRSAGTVNTEKMNKLMAEARGTRNLRDKAAAITQLLGGT